MPLLLASYLRQAGALGAVRRDGRQIRRAWGNVKQMPWMLSN